MPKLVDLSLGTTTRSRIFLSNFEIVVFLFNFLAIPTTCIGGNLTCRPITMRRLGYHAIAYTFVRQYSFHICAIVLLASMLRSSRDWQLTNAK